MESKREFIRKTELKLCKKYGVSPDFLDNRLIKIIEEDYLIGEISQSEFVDRIEVEITCEALNEVMLDEEMLEEEE